jgi:hypothetical protein
VAAKQLLTEAYEQSAGIFDYFTQSEMDKVTLDVNTKRPLLSMSLSPSEDMYTYSKMFEVIKSFADNHVKDFYGINLQEFLQYPRVICDFLLKDSEHRLLNKLNSEAAAINGIKNFTK